MLEIVQKATDFLHDIESVKLITLCIGLFDIGIIFARLKLDYTGLIIALFFPAMFQLMPPPAIMVIYGAGFLIGRFVIWRR